MERRSVCLHLIAGAVLASTAVPCPVIAQRKPVIQQIEPTSGPPGAAVHIIGRRFSENAEVRLGRTELKVERSLPNRLTVRVPPGATTGRLTVKTVVGETVGPEFRVVEPRPAPEIYGFEPQQGPPGTEVTVSGSNFASRFTSNVVMIGDHPVVVRYASPTELRVIVPESAATGKLSVKVMHSGRAESQGVFTVSAATKIFDFQPRRGAPGTEVIISGSGFSPRVGDNRAYLNNAPLKLLKASDSELVVRIPQRAVSGPLLVDVSGAGRAHTKGEHFVVQHPPSVVGFSPAKAPPGAQVTLRGTNFGTNPVPIEVKLGDKALKVRKADNTRLVVEIAEGAVDGRFSVTVHGVGPAWSKEVFDVIAPLRINRFRPRSGPAGTRVTIEGSGFSISAARNSVTLAGRPLKVISALSKELVVQVSPGPSGPISVSVRGRGETRSTDPFVVTVPPRITGFEPTSAAVGSEVKIRGSGFGTNLSAVKATLAGDPLEVSSVRDDMLVVRVPAGAKTGRLAVSIPLQGTSMSETSFKVLAAKGKSGAE